MRLFIGVPLSEDYARILRRILDVWRPRLASRISWVRPKLAHATLKFLGEVGEDQLAVIVAAMRGVIDEAMLGKCVDAPNRP